MSASLGINGSTDVRVVAGESLALRIAAYDPNGISKIFVQCFQFSMTSSSKAKLAVGEVSVVPEQSYSQTSFDVNIPIPENAAVGKWGVQLIEFTNRRGYKSSFYRGHGKFDKVVFEVIPPPSKEDELLRFDGVEIAGRGRCA
ncbi:MAG TPA: hypothetical protein VNO24_09250 [Blastocatellia bacterium]|jgi:hypothetical protein|nr:hypothetical protein [Blastocatellia bacterium]